MEISLQMGLFPIFIFQPQIINHPAWSSELIGEEKNRKIRTWNPPSLFSLTGIPGLNHEAGLIFFHLFSFVMCMDVLPACWFVHHVHVMPKESRRGGLPLGLESQTALSLQEEEQPVLLTTEPALQPQYFIVLFREPPFSFILCNIVEKASGL